MNKKHYYQVSLVAPGVWHQAVNDSFRVLDTRQQCFARSILKTMHDRHVGITPDLAAELAPALLDFKAQVRGPWAKVFKRLIDELALIRNPEKTGRFIYKERHFGVLASANPVYSVFRLAMPVVEYACGLIHQCYLFCEDNIPSSVWRSDYKAYSKALSDQITLMAENTDEEVSQSFDLFWKDRAATLSGFSREPAGSGARLFQVPETEPVALAFLLRLEPDMPHTKQNPRRLKRLTTPLERRKIHKLKQDGVDGIHVTRRDEDLNNILFSEFMNDEIILADRLVNTGFFAIQREPKREKLRDVLIAGLMPGCFQNTLSADFIKACWFDALMRLSIVLRGKQMLKSQFRWTEADRFGRARTCEFFLENMHTFESIGDAGPTDAYPREFLSALRWLPSYLDTRERFSSVVKDASALGSDAETNKTEIEALKDWAFSAWSDQKKSVIRISPGQKKTFSTHHGVSWFNFDDFAFIHIMMFLPARLSPACLSDEESLKNESDPGPLFRGFGIGNYAGRNVSITWIPDTIGNIGNWAFAARGRPVSLLFPGEQADISERKIAGELVKTWFNQWIKEIWVE